MNIYKYKDYNEYVEAQRKANERKLNYVYADPVSLKMVCKYIERHITPKFILCHGTRNGLEQRIFKEFFGCKVLGTEISPTASQFPNTIQWDFHEVKPEWIDNVDVIYSNSFDHSYDPGKCLDAWMSCTNLCIIEYSELCDTNSSQSDPFAATLQEYIDMIEKKYTVIDVLSNEGLQDEGKTFKGKREFIVIQ